MLEDNESQKRKELEQGFNAKMKTVIDEQGPKKEVSYKMINFHLHLICFRMYVMGIL